MYLLQFTEAAYWRVPPVLDCLADALSYWRTPEAQLFLEPPQLESYLRVLIANRIIVEIIKHMLA